MKRDGFTLLEVMVCLAIVGGLLVTLIYSLNYHLGIAGRHEFITVASVLARNKITEIENSPSASKGDFPAPFSAFRYSAELKDSPFPGISELLVVVSRGDEAVTFSQLVERPR